MNKSNVEGLFAPPPLSELHALRTDFQDVEVESLGGTTLRVYALSGLARADLMADNSDLADKQDATDPATVRRVFTFQVRVVAYSLGYPQDQWEQVGETLGSGAIEQLFDVAMALSGLDEREQTKATERLRPKRNAVSGTA